MKQNFWKWSNGVESTDSELILEGVVASEEWWGDEIVPSQFREELSKRSGDLTVAINSVGGDVFAGISIYNSLVQYSGRVTVRVDGLAASIASIIAMAGDKIIMSPGSEMMIHKPWTLAIGDSEELQKNIEILDKIQESLVSIYTARTGLTKEEIVTMLEAETWMTADEAVEKGFADEALPAKSKSISSMLKNALGGEGYREAVMASVRESEKASIVNAEDKLKALNAETEEAQAEPVEEVQNVPEPEAPVATDEVVEEATTEAEAEVETKAEEVTEPLAEEIKPTVKEETIMAKTQDEIATEGIVAVAPVQEVKAQSNYLATKGAVEDFAEVLKANAGKSFADVKAEWKERLVQNGITDTDYFALPDPLVTNIEDAVKASGIFNALNHTGLDVTRVDWDDTDSEADTSRAGGHAKGDTKDEQVLDFDKRVIRAQYIYKYLVLNKEDIRENRSTGALIRFVLNELPTRIIREIERAVVIGDGRAANDKRKITSFFAVKADVVAGNDFATSYTPVAGETRYASLVKAMEELEAEGDVYLVHKKGFLTDLMLQTNANGGYIFAPGTDVSRAMGFAGAFKPTWFNDTTDPDYDAYLVVFSGYKTVGDSSIESFTNFKLETNENEFLQEIYKGGGLSVRKAAVGIASTGISS